MEMASGCKEHLAAGGSGSSDSQSCSLTIEILPSIFGLHSCRKPHHRTSQTQKRHLERSLVRPKTLAPPLAASTGAHCSIKTLGVGASPGIAKGSSGDCRKEVRGSNLKGLSPGGGTDHLRTPHPTHTHLQPNTHSFHGSPGTDDARLQGRATLQNVH